MSSEGLPQKNQIVINYTRRTSQFIICNDYSCEMFDFFANHTVLEGDFKLSDIKVQQQLGRGNAHVYIANIKGESYALKQIQIKNDYEYQSFLKEITFMKELSQLSQWFVKYYGYLLTKMERNQYDKKKYAFIIMECAEINLEQFLSQRKNYKDRLKTNEIVIILEQILSALASLEEMQIAHCDIKPENILIMDSNKLTVKLCDVGSCKIVSKQSLEQATILGTVPFLAPELIKTKNNKIASTNPFKSDVFSFGLVILYLTTQKKFKSHERLQIEEITYKQVIFQWIKESKQLCDGDLVIFEVLKQALEFDQFKRSTFKALKFVCFNEKKKKSILLQNFIERLEKQQQMRASQFKMQQTSYFSSQPSNHLNLFKSRKMQKVGFTKTISNGNAFKISKSRNSQSPVKRTISCISSSPQKTEKSIGSMKDLLLEMKRVIYISEENRFLLPEQIPDQSEKYFVLATPEIRFKRAQSITLLPTCTYDIFYQMESVQCKRLYVETMEKEILGVPIDAPILNFSKIRLNLSRCDMIGGFEGLFRIIANSSLELLELRMTQTEIQMKQVLYLLDRLAAQSPFLQTLLLNLERRLITEEEHVLVLDRLARLPVKKLTLIMNQCYIQCEKPTRWPLPKHCEILNLEYGNNLLKNFMNNLSISLSSSTSLKELSINFENNALTKGQIHMLIKSITGLKTLERVSFNFSFNKIGQAKYLQNVLLQLLKINFLEIKLHRTEVDLKKIIDLVESLKELFEFDLKVLKISCDRNMPLRLFKDAVEIACHATTAKGKALRADVIGFDNRFFTVYLKKNEKGHSTRIKGGPAAKRSVKLEVIPKAQTMTEGITLSNFNSASKLNSICYQFYTSSESFQNYLCLTCCESRQMSKYMHYCKFCMVNCMHAAVKDHYFVKMYESSRCVCAYSGHCKSQNKPVVCGDKMGAELKKEYQCFKCLMSFCMVCITQCQDTHKEWVKECGGLGFFKCSSKITH